MRNFYKLKNLFLNNTYLKIGIKLFIAKNLKKAILKTNYKSIDRSMLFVL